MLVRARPTYLDWPEAELILSPGALLMPVVGRVMVVSFLIVGAALVALGELSFVGCGIVEATMHSSLEAARLEFAIVHIPYRTIIVAIVLAAGAASALANLMELSPTTIIP